MNRFFDWWLELRIAFVQRLLVAAKTSTAQRLYAGVLYELIDRRSAGQRARMERAKGLS